MLCSYCRKAIPNIDVAALRAELDLSACICDHTRNAIAVRKGELEAKELIAKREDAEESTLRATLERIGSRISAWISVALDGVEAEGEVIDPPLGEPIAGFVKGCDEILTEIEVVLGEGPETPWTPTPEAINALSAGVRSYIHDLEARADPAGDVRARAVAEQQARDLAAALVVQRDHYEKQRGEPGPCPPCMECGGPTALYGVFDLIEWNCRDTSCGSFTMKSIPGRTADDVKGATNG